MLPAAVSAVSDTNSAPVPFVQPRRFRFAPTPIILLLPTLSDPDFRIFPAGFPGRLQAFQCEDQRAIAGAAGIPGVGICFQFLNPSGSAHVRKRPGGLVQHNQFRPGGIRISGAKPGGHGDIGNLVHGIADAFTDIGIAQYRVQAGEDPVHDNRVSAFLKIQIPADVVHQNKLGRQNRIQMGDRFVQAEGMKTPLFAVGDYSLCVFHSACNPGLTVPFEDRQIDEKLRFCHLAAEL